MQSGGCSIRYFILDGEKGGKVLFTDSTKLSRKQSGDDRAFLGAIEVYSIASAVQHQGAGRSRGRKKTVEKLGIAHPLGTYISSNQ